MKIKSLRFQYLLATALGILTVAALISLVSILGIKDHIWQEARALLTNICEKESTQINALLSELEISVDAMEVFVLNQVDDTADLADPEKLASLIRSAETIFHSMAQQTDGCETFYLRFAPELTTPTSGFFWGKGEDGRFESLTPTDISLYDHSDRERVGWYWEPVSTGGPLWVKPYYNQNYGIDMISYCVPIYHNGVLLAVAGMDFDLAALADQVNSIRVYEHGYAYLLMDQAIIHHGVLDVNVQEPDVSATHIRMSGQIKNGMELVILADNGDIQAVYGDIAARIITIVSFLVIAVLAAMSVMLQKHVRVFEKLTEASVKLASGDYDIRFETSHIKEVDQMYSAFQKMSAQLSVRDHRQQQMAYRDSLTGLRNANAFQSWLADNGPHLLQSQEPFGIMVLDLNNLKETNDTHGHATGDKLIVSAAKLIANSFKHSPVFRNGGDEFVVVLQNSDLEHYDDIIHSFDELTRFAYADGNRDCPVNIARGAAFYTAGTDTSVEDVFRRADATMYANKQLMKKQAAAH